GFLPKPIRDNEAGYQARFSRHQESREGCSCRSPLAIQVPKPRPCGFHVFTEFIPTYGLYDGLNDGMAEGRNSGRSDSGDFAVYLAQCFVNLGGGGGLGNYAALDEAVDLGMKDTQGVSRFRNEVVLGLEEGFQPGNQVLKGIFCEKGFYELLIFAVLDVWFFAVGLQVLLSEGF